MSNKFDLTPKLNVLPDNPDPKPRGRFPKWLRQQMPKGDGLFSTDEVIQKHRLYTVCEEAKCPNRVECYSKNTATFLILGSACTRACGFCEIDFAKKPLPPDPEEPMHVATSVEKLKLRHAVITMVARDDLPDGGADHLAKTIEAVRNHTGATVEVLTSDFAGNFDALDRVLEAAPEIFNYNLETVQRLSPRVRHKATYDLTLSILKHVKKSGVSRFVKSGMMLGFDETEQEVQEAMCDLQEAGVDIITLGQYLQPSLRKLRVKKFVTPEQYKALETFGKKIGVRYVYAGPFVRSSYNAETILKQLEHGNTPSRCR